MAYAQGSRNRAMRARPSIGSLDWLYDAIVIHCTQELIPIVLLSHVTDLDNWLPRISRARWTSLQLAREIVDKVWSLGCSSSPPN
eukprot:CAMPEP_0169208154 /NCGR_PEP_ID=MMETSP1016-20121227/13975_1 /TAXON_ID=342587 /ORGANISM="Karlodinium micrum, Strain CCMP2283" /LENGTH=84 /DNA_ID=CAMNT_0009285499 /DNA_START=355 /DNA_END=606 /DNA_ORIENTATION=-